MTIKINTEENVKWPSLKKYPCKRGKGQHEYSEPKIKYKPSVRYIYQTERGILESGKIEDGYKYLRTEVGVVLETICKKCGHKCLSFLRDNIK